MKGILKKILYIATVSLIFLWTGCSQMRDTKKLICFDLDGTLTQHKTQLTPENKAVLDTLMKRYEVIMVGAGNCPRIYHQMNDYPITIIGNYGMQESHIVDGKFVITREDTVPVDTAFFVKNCNYLREKYGYKAVSYTHLTLPTNREV